MKYWLSHALCVTAYKLSRQQVQEYAATVQLLRVLRGEVSA